MPTGRGDTSLMASANLDLVRSILADWERGDFSSAEWADPNIEYVTVGGPEPGSSTAKDSHSLRAFLSVWDDYRTEAEEYRQIAHAAWMELVGPPLTPGEGDTIA